MRGGIARDEPSVLFGGARRRRIASWLSLLTVLGVVAGVVIVRPVPAREAPPAGSIGPAPAPPLDDGRGEDVVYPIIEWKASRALGLPFRNGRLVRGVQLPAEGPDWFTWDPVLNVTDNRGARRWGTDALLRTLIATLRSYRAEDPEAPRVGVMDMSRSHGGWFGKVYGGLGHASHQNGLDVDVLYPRSDTRERRPFVPAQVDRERAQRLVDLFVEAGAEKIFVGPRLGLTGPRGVVISLVYHDDHLHVRIPPPPE